MANTVYVYEVHLSDGRVFREVHTTCHHDEPRFRDHVVDVLKRTAGTVAGNMITKIILKGRR